jgi:rSAM/selenodomain-associated transferase 2
VRVAVVIPTLNEAVRIGPLLEQLTGFDEVIVADGGSTDGTPELAAAATVVHASGGRGPQLNAGARAASSELLLFLHADTSPPEAAPQLIRDALRAPRVAGGAFRASFDGGGPVMRFAAWCTRFDTGLTTFGDQGCFTRRADFEAVGGFPDWPFLEDVELRRRLKRRGRFVKLAAEVRTSARRFQSEGVLRRFVLNAWVLLRHRLGARPEQLLHLYRSGA